MSFFIAPMDLAASMGYVGDRDHPEVKEAIARAEACIKKSWVPWGIMSICQRRQ